jgi:hypothetical protein
MFFKLLLVAFLLSATLSIHAQTGYELNTGWLCSSIKNAPQQGTEISTLSFPVKNWLPATVPGTVLTTMLNNKLVPDPFYGMNNKLIPDIFETGRDYYTYWFVKDFKETAPHNNDQVLLNFRGINYGCDVFLNGHKLNEQTHHGMYLRVTYNISRFLAKDGNNRLAVIVYPPNPVGNPNGGQGGDGEIARNVSHQYVAGWDWIQPTRDRNTGIWDKVTIEKNGGVNLKNPHIISIVPGKRYPGKLQQPAIIRASAELENATNSAIAGVLLYQLDGKTIQKEVSLAPLKTTEVALPDFTLTNPKLWWPAGYGKQDLYNIQFQFISKQKIVLDKETVSLGVREIQTSWNKETKSREVAINGQKIFIKGGNWIISDAMLRFTPERYDAEIRFHRDMNLNLIRIWGGALSERPEFYQACDKYGLLVFQDFWFSGDCNGRWLDPMKKDDQWTRRNYPDDHQLALASITDQVKMIRNHPSLAFYCGGNEITPPADIFNPLKDSILPKIDGTRYFFDYSNTDSMSYNSIGGNGDGPYNIQEVASFWENKTFPFNSEIGSVGTGDYESLERFLPAENRVAPQFIDGKSKVDSVWDYHKYIGYNQHIDPYGKPADIKDFGLKAQLVNYDQYRGLIEGFSAHMWNWYTGVIIWKTQNPWTALRGQMYDYYLDPNACLYGLHHAGEPVHVMYNAVAGNLMVVNNSFETLRNCMLELKVYDKEGKENLLIQDFIEIGPTTVQSYNNVQKQLDELRKGEGLFLSLRLLDINKKPISENMYWLPDAAGNYSGLQKMKPANVKVVAKQIANGKLEVTIHNSANGTLAFFNRISLLNEQTGKRILPVFYSDNYISVFPGQQKTITLEYTPSNIKSVVSVSGWNVKEQSVPIE